MNIFKENASEQTPRRRLLRLVIFYSSLLASGLLYALICRLLGGGIPCLFHVMTGLRCPGCGITRMALCLLSFELAEAFEWNSAAFIALPFAVFVIIYQSIIFIKTGSGKLTRLSNVILIFLIVLFLGYAVIRNII